ncbi:hypothetical protein N658DRAFT_516625 [Parathielavia hyrcaniae]|uniref:Uncharacterized protein n=1 Tax=Parathielavia hyrcaniae TaxID=113614 RepID=A0AAN6Q0K4_9PEZI|nr:hypothetical protein N658DRAFT_516625 [Parathielavia hyrcaniae]
MRSRFRSRSPRTDERTREEPLDEGGFSSRYGKHDGDRNLGRDRMREGDVRESERSSKRRRFDYQEERERGDEPSTRGNGESGGLSRRHHHRREHTHRHRHRPTRRASAERTSPPKELPLGARQLSRSDLATFMPLFAHYLDLQKQLDISSLDETEIRGRWKSFMGKWNRGELAEGWYDADVFASAVRDYQDLEANNGSPDRPQSPSPSRSARPISPNDDDDAYGPPPPPAPGQPHQQHTQHHHHTTAPPSSSARAPGPSIPTETDLSLRDEARAAEQASSLAAHRLARRAQRAEEKALVDEVAPRAEAGTRERRLEKRRELNEKLKGFRDKSPGGGAAAELPEGELMGGGDAVEEYRAVVRARQEKKKERVSRREEADRARRAEREERVRVYQEREERVVEGLRELARMRFGAGGGG